MDHLQNHLVTLDAPVLSERQEPAADLHEFREISFCLTHEIAWNFD